MKMKLFYKFFLLFLMTFILVVVFMAGIMRFSVYRHFSDYVAQTELDNLEPLAAALAEIHHTHNGWHTLKNNDRLWHQILARNLIPEKPDGFNPPGRADHAAAPQELKPHDIQSARDNISAFPEDALSLSRGRRPPPHSPPIPEIGRRLSVHDADKNPVIGPSDFSGTLLRPITADQRVVGWLGLQKKEQLTHPADVSFLKQQSRSLYMIGGAVFLLAMVVAALFSRHLLLPIRHIADGTKALRERRFQTRIRVAASDELGRLARDFNEMAGHLEQYETMRRRWLSDISHELRTPLAVLRGEIEALQDGIRRPGPEAIASLHAEVMHLSHIVNDLNQISQLESGILEMDKTVVDPVDILKNTIDRFAHRLDQRKIDIKTALDDQGSVRITGDGDRLSQVFSNIFENILRYAASPGAVSAGFETAGQQVTISIADSGPGVPEESIGRLFDRFYRTDTARSRENGGSGLGLAICKSIVEAHQGTISATNAPGGGLKIDIHFPLWSTASSPGNPGTKHRNSGQRTTS